MPQWLTRPNLPFPLEGNAAKRQRVYEAERRYETPLPICPPNGGLLYLCVSLRYLPSSTPSPLRGPLPLKGTQGLAPLALFPPISYKNCFFPKIPITNRNFFAFPENILYVENFRHKKKDRRAGPFPFHSSQKLLILPMLMRGRASRLPSSVNRPGVAAETECLCRQRRKSTLYCHQDV